MENELNKKNSEYFMIQNRFYDVYAEFLGPYAISVYLALCRYRNNETGRAFPSQDLLARRLKISIKSVTRHIKLLYKYNLVRVVSREKDPYTRKWVHNVYQITGERYWILPDLSANNTLKSAKPWDSESAIQRSNRPINNTKNINTKYVSINEEVMSFKEKLARSKTL